MPKIAQLTNPLDWREVWCRPWTWGLAVISLGLLTWVFYPDAVEALKGYSPTGDWKRFGRNLANLWSKYIQEGKRDVEFIKVRFVVNRRGRKVIVRAKPKEESG